jgi:hypothetical protein
MTAILHSARQWGLMAAISIDEKELIGVDQDFAAMKEIEYSPQFTCYYKQRIASAFFLWLGILQFRNLENCSQI